MAQSFLHTEVDPHQIKNIPVPGSMRDFDDPPRDFKKTNFSTFLKCFETIIVKSLPSIIVMELSISFTLVNIYLVEGNRG